MPDVVDSFGGRKQIYELTFGLPFQTLMYNERNKMILSSF